MSAQTKLPKGAKPISQKRAVGGWVEMEFDASIVRHAITWLRVKGGMGDAEDREDWIADLPALCVSVHDYQFRPPFWGFTRYKSFDAALLGETRSSIETADRLAKEHAAKATKYQRAAKMLRQALKQTL